MLILLKLNQYLLLKLVINAAIYTEYFNISLFIYIN